MGLDEPFCNHAVFSKNGERLLSQEVVGTSFDRVVRQAKKYLGAFPAVPSREVAVPSPLATSKTGQITKSNSGTPYFAVALSENQPQGHLNDTGIPRADDLPETPR